MSNHFIGNFLNCSHRAQLECARMFLIYNYSYRLPSFQIDFPPNVVLYIYTYYLFFTESTQWHDTHILYSDTRAKLCDDCKHQSQSQQQPQKSVREETNEGRFTHSVKCVVAIITSCLCLVTKHRASRSVVQLAVINDDCQKFFTRRHALAHRSCDAKLRTPFVSGWCTSVDIHQDSKYALLQRCNISSMYRYSILFFFQESRRFFSCAFMYIENFAHLESVARFAQIIFPLYQGGQPEIVGDIYNYICLQSRQAINLKFFFV